jgi:hypothetical protein
MAANDSIVMDEVPSQLIHYILRRDYYLSKKDAKDIVNLYKFSISGKGLSNKEITEWKKLGIINANNQVMLDNAFMLDNTVLPSYWLKVLMMKKGMLFMAWQGNEHEITPIRKS